MRAPRIIVRAALVCGLAGTAWCAWSTLDEHSAHATDKRPAAVERPRGLPDRPVSLPDRASDRARQAVAKVTAHVPAPVDEPTEDQAETPEPAPPADPPVELPPVLDPPPVVVDPAPVELPPAEPAPAETPPTVDLPPAPQADPLPAPPADLPDVQLPAEVAAPPLPVAIAPIPAASPPPTGAVAELVAELTAGPDQPADCADQPDDAQHLNRDALRALLAGHDPEPAAATHTDSGCPGAPANPAGPHIDISAAPGHGQTSAEQLAADVTGAAPRPALARLHQLLPRGDIPASRTTHPEPGPA